MKKMILIACAVLALSQMFAQPLDKFITFRPSRGLNNGTDQGALNGGKDAWVYEGNPSQLYDTVSNFYSLPISNCNSTHAWALIRFDLDTLPANVDSVFAGFFHDPHTTYCYSHCDANWYFYKIKGDWEENTVTYSNAPALGDTFFGPINITFPNNLGQREYNITEQYKRWKNGTDTNRGFAIYSPSVGCNNAAVGFYSHSSDDTAENMRPYLKIYFRQTNLIEEFEHSTSVFPNPAQHAIHIRSGEALQVVEVLNPAGRMVYRIQARGRHLDMKTDMLPDGIYYLKIYGQTAKCTRKIAVLH